jgi:vacuolar protein sorting-associated protein 72
MTDENNDDTPLRTEDDNSDSGSGNDSSSESEEEQTEWLVTTREKRSTAGNRMTSLLQQEEPDDELELLFEEIENDEVFEDDEADSDVQMDSSDDDDDQGPAAGADDLEGEKELQKKERAEKLRRRKLNDGIPKIYRKKDKIDPTTSQGRSFGATQPRPKKKSERASWIPTPEDAPTRASQRGSTRQSKDELHKQMVDREIKRLKQLANMEKAAARKEAAKKPAMTQADRLAEAARVEKRNQKSLSRWEEAEQQREEEQLAKLAALSGRLLEGPVITMWSGMAEWVGGTLKKVGKNLELEDPKEKQSKKRKALEMLAESEATASVGSVSGDQTVGDVPPSESTTVKLENTAPLHAHPPSSIAPLSTTEASPIAQVTPLMAPPQPYYPSIPQHIHITAQQYDTPSNQPSVLPTHSIAPSTTSKPPSHPPFILAPPQGFQYIPPSLDGSAPLPGFGPVPHLPHLMPPRTTPFAYSSHNQPIPETPPPAVQGPPTIEHSTRNCIILGNFDETLIKDKNVQMQVIFRRKFTKIPSKFPVSPSLSKI